MFCAFFCVFGSFRYDFVYFRVFSKIQLFCEKYVFQGLPLNDVGGVGADNRGYGKFQKRFYEEKFAFSVTELGVRGSV